MKLALLAILCYAVGSINPAYILGKIKGFDIRKSGSNNAGASNAVITMGTKAGVFTALFDIFKAFLCYKLGSWLFPDLSFAGVLCASLCALGHIFPFYMNFKGGKGFACIGGLILGYNYKVFLIMLAAAIILVFIINYISIITCMTALSFPVIYLLMTKDTIGTIILCILGIVIVSRHFVNFRRIKDGTEVRFSLLYNRKKEEERLRGIKENRNDE